VHINIVIDITGIDTVCNICAA